MWIARIYLVLFIILTWSLTGCTPKINAMNLTPAITSFPSITATPKPTLETIRGSLGNQIATLEVNMPRRDSEGYVIPTTQEQADFGKLIAMMMTNELRQAVDLATKNNYTMSYYVDRGDNDAVSYLLREQEPIQKGWGLYTFRLESTSNIIIEAPHPIYDRRTPSVALDIYRALDARALMVAGAHRNANSDGSADVAHAKESIFQSIHIALTREIEATSGNAIILQIHGFHASKHKGYPQVVFGLGEKPLPQEIAIAEKLKEALAKQGIRAGVCTGVESNLLELCAKTNVQGSVTDEGAFIHIELDENIRDHDDALVAALVEVFGS